MRKWQNKVKLKHLFTENEDHESVKKSMKQVADELRKHSCFFGFSETDKFYDIPKGNGVITPLDYANKLINWMYDYADQQRIWID